jgi:hypothetical protein
MKNSIFSILLLLLAFSIQAQSNRTKPKKFSDAKNTIYIYWGYNRAAYTKSSLHCVGSGYDFTFNKALSHDRQEKKLITYINPTTITVPQFNLRLGYNFMDHYSVSLGIDHLKYIMTDNQTVNMTGHIDPGVDPYWSGDYHNTPTFLADNHIHYENTNGMNFIRLQFARMDQWYRTKKNGWFALSTVFGLSTGMILSFNDWKFGGIYTTQIVSLSGYGFSATAGLRLEFWKHLFLQTNIAGGFIHQTHVKSRPNGPDYIQQKLGYIASETVFGLMFYIHGKNNCNTCPKW